MVNPKRTGEQQRIAECPRGQKGHTMHFLENYRGFGAYLTESGYIARNRERILTAKTYVEIIECIYLWTCC